MSRKEWRTVVVYGGVWGERWRFRPRSGFLDARKGGRFGWCGPYNLLSVGGVLVQLPSGKMSDFALFCLVVYLFIC